MHAVTATLWHNFVQCLLHCLHEFISCSLLQVSSIFCSCWLEECRVRVGIKNSSGFESLIVPGVFYGVFFQIMFINVTIVWHLVKWYSCVLDLWIFNKGEKVLKHQKSLSLNPRADAYFMDLHTVQWSTQKTRAIVPVCLHVQPIIQSTRSDKRSYTGT